MALALRPERPKTAIMGVEVGSNIRLCEVVRPLLRDWQRDRAGISSLYYPGNISVCVGSVVEILSPEEESRNWYLYVTSVKTDVDAEVEGYFFFTMMNIRQGAGAEGFKSELLFPTHEKFTASLGSVLRTVHVLPEFMRSDADDECTFYFNMFWDSVEKELRPINWQLKTPWHLLEFFAHTSVVSSGGGERNLALFRKGIMRGLHEFCDKWRTKIASPKRKLRIQVDVDLQHLMCLPFSVLELACFDEERQELNVEVEGHELDSILGEHWNVVKVKARRVEEGEELQFNFSCPAVLKYKWSRQDTVLTFEGVSMYNGAGVLQWSTFPNPVEIAQG